MNRVILALVMLLGIAVPSFAQGEKARPNTLTPKEIGDGWILLFDGETTFGWKLQRGEGLLTVSDNALDLGKARDVVSSTTFREFECSFEYKTPNGPAQLALFCETEREGMLMDLDKVGDWSTFELRLSNANLQFAKGGKVVNAKWSHPSALMFPTLGKNPNLKIRNIKLRPLNTKSIFNGKDLTGWRVFPGDKYKSKFTVNAEGAINVKDGPGDLQTVGKYKDFILQFDCISNGMNLNSGVFFRCRDNEYQNGYEAQIRNQFTKEATQKYVVEEYDAKTNMLLAKKDVMSTAFDYGTGAIYRRVPARKEMSKDNEWFAMTIVAHGNHLAAWVNGVQVTDWTDNRPKSDNARTGQKLDAGHISIQGHDPTTDLSFKNFRIAELK